MNKAGNHPIVLPSLRREVFTGESVMKLIMCLIGALALFGTAGCEFSHEEHHPRGGYYDGYYHDSGRGYYYPERHWDHDRD